MPKTNTKSQADAKEARSIELSQMSKALVEAAHVRYPHETPLEGEQYKVSQAVSFFGFMYERIRNAVEFNEEHLIRRIAISRILRRRLAVNPDGEGEGENLARELLWGRYVPEDIVSQQDVEEFQTIIYAYLQFFGEIRNTHDVKSTQNLGSMVLDLMSCEIEEAIDEEKTQKLSAHIYFFYQTLRNKIYMKDVPEDQKDAYFYAAAERALARNDTPFIMYHLFMLKYGPLHMLTSSELKTAASEFHVFLSESRNILRNQYSDQLVKFAQKQVPPYKILYSILERNEDAGRSILEDPEQLHDAVEEVCTEKYALTRDKLRNAAIKSITYIFLTKMIIVLIFEIPVTQILYGELELIPIGINTLLPPLLMGFIVTFTNPPSDRNTERIYSRIVDILKNNPESESKQKHIAKSKKTRRPILFFLFSVLYVLTFTLVFSGLYLVLDGIGFNIISKAIFVFFISVVAFFGYRIRQTANEYVLDSRENVFFSFVTFLFLPLLSLGKFFSEQVSRINLFIIFFDYIIEAPSKFLFELVEEWTRFLKARKDELV